MTADEETTRAIRELVVKTYEAMSTPGSDVAALFGADDIAITGSGQDEMWSGPGEVAAVAAVVASRGLTWRPDTVTVWRRGEVAWARIIGSVQVPHDEGDKVVPYWTTGVFQCDHGLWRWAYWGGSEPQESPQV